jgi:signal transduction histidine kinase/DNA-binding response OmpR family regulator
VTNTFRDPVSGSSVASENLRKSRVNSLLKDGNLVYISTDHTIFAFNLNTRKVIQAVINNSDSVPDLKSRYYGLLKSNEGDIWVTSNNKGLRRICFNKETQTLSLGPYASNKFTKFNILENENISLYQDKDGILWLGNQHLQRINLKTGDIKTFKLVDNIDFIGVYSILEDNHENLWLGTGFGLCRFNKKSGETRLFTREDGWPIKGHTYLTAYKGPDGNMYFGGEGGFYSFHPDSVKTNNWVPPVVITDLRVSNREIKIDSTGNGILSRNVAYTKSIELDHDQNDISFEFAVLDYSRPVKNKYSYKLEGYQDKWIETDSGNRIAAFTNLDPGKYTFRVKGSNSDGIWNEEGASLTILIHSPWWSTPLAWSFYVLLFVISITTYIRWRTWRLKKEKSEIEALVDIRTGQVEKQKSEILAQKDLLEAQNQKIIDLDQAKSRFFTNISHEFRTPLSLIQGPVEELLDSPRRTVKERGKLNVMYRNARRLLNLVNQLLDISRIDTSVMKLEITKSDLMGFLRPITASFNSLAEIREISYKCIFPSEQKNTWFDPDKCEKVVTNLLSNAFKFTPRGGTIIFRANYKYDEEQVPVALNFSVQDNGCGIPGESLEKIFDRFYQVEESIRNESGGAGIGLSLARDMVRLMHGEITVTSQPGKGSTFSVQFPLGKEHLDKNEYNILNELPETVMSPLLSGSEVNYLTEKEDGSLNKKPVLLLVEDNIDIRAQLADNFQSKYNIKLASDGVVGLKKATEIIPDLIITDLMMPFMDGIEMCNRLKNDERTCHIPIIMLTAKVTIEDKIYGLQTGADDYIPKPFHLAELKARVNNLIEQRKKLRERFSKEITLQLSDISITSLDEKFLRKAVTLVEQHLNDEHFDLPKFREEMNMSSSTLFRKFHALTNQSPTEFIRTLRLKRAASLLSQNFGNITQVSLEVGFNNLSYFNKSFRKMFGVSPTEYARNHRS